MEGQAFGSSYYAIFPDNLLLCFATVSFLPHPIRQAQDGGQGYAEIWDLDSTGH